MPLLGRLLASKNACRITTSPLRFGRNVSNSSWNPLTPAGRLIPYPRNRGFVNCISLVKDDKGATVYSSSALHPGPTLGAMSDMQIYSSQPGAVHLFAMG